MDIIINTILGYLVSLAVNLRTDAIHACLEEKLREQLEQEDSLIKAFASTRPLRDELRVACVEIARNRDILGITPHEEPLLRLLSDDTFQADLVEWFRAGGIQEGNAVKERIRQRMEVVLTQSNVPPGQIAFLRSGYFEAVDKAVFSHPNLAHWRHQMSLDYLREQVAYLRQLAEKAAGVYSPEKQKAALDHYCEKALAAWDIIDLSNLPEGDVLIATQKLLLRQLYMPLRIKVEQTKSGEVVLSGLEEQRESRRHREAGHLFAGEPDRPDGAKSRYSVGERLGVSQRLVVLGDPGGGKTTMLRWMATAYLLLHKGGDAFNQLPDTKTLPGKSCMPVLIRCRDLGEADQCRSFTEFLTQHLHKTELLPEDAEVMCAVILDRIARGEVLLLVDGLDEITKPGVRMMFCQELERTVARYPDTPIVVTSRIVGYRDMPYRMESGFEHGVIAELNREDKDLFARRWVEVTEQHQSAAEKTRRVQELLEALHSSDRIERLTGNPMLLTTLALVKRKVGKLPNRRNKLYAEAVSVLLNWNPRHYDAIDENEAIPQLAYLAYEMCRRGVQRLTNDEVLDLLEKLRIEYPNVRAIRRREPQAFLELLEARSSILIKAGSIWQKNKGLEDHVWEFRHLTFQEYLAARALLDGRYPGRDKTKSLAEQVAPLAGVIQKAKSRSSSRKSEDEVEVPESWREALRLLVADCKDDDVDEVLLAILNPMAGEDTSKTSRSRAVLATLCLADEPNISEETAKEVIDKFAASVQRGDGRNSTVNTSLDSAALEVSGSCWAMLLRESLIQEYIRVPDQMRNNIGGLWGTVEVAGWRRYGLEPAIAFGALVGRLQSDDRVEVLSAALSVMVAAYEKKAANVQGLIENLFMFLGKGSPEKHAAAWALLWLSGGWVLPLPPKKVTWLPSEPELEVLANTLNGAPNDDSNLKCYLINILGKVPNQKGLAAIILKLGDADKVVRKAAIEALGQLGDKRAVPPLLTKLDDPDNNVRKAAVVALGQLGDKQAEARLILLLDDQVPDVCAAAADALIVLGAVRGRSALTKFLDHHSPEMRKAAVKELVRLRDKPNERTLLSRDLDGGYPWIDPGVPITETRIADAACGLGITNQEARSLYEEIAADFHLKFA